jgi:hypothetical protein
MNSGTVPDHQHVLTPVLPAELAQKPTDSFTVEWLILTS